MNVRLRIKASPGAGVTADEVKELQKEWEKGEDKWSGKFKLVDKANAMNIHRVRVDFQFVATGAHQNISVRPGPARSKMMWENQFDQTEALRAIKVELDALVKTVSHGQVY